MDEKVGTMIWMLIFFVVFYLYIDIRLTKLRQELLSHYMLCERMLTHGLKNDPSSQPSQQTTTQHAATNVPYDGDSFLNIIPTREEIAEGLVNLKQEGGWLTG